VSWFTMPVDISGAVAARPVGRVCGSICGTGNNGDGGLS
jgi:hypothetical protein